MSADIIFRFVSYFSAGSVLIPLLFSIKLRKFSLQEMVLLAYILLSAITEAISLYLVKIAHISNEQIFHGFRVLEVLLLVYLYLFEFNWNRLMVYWPIAILLTRAIIIFLFPEIDRMIFGVIAQSILIGLSIYWYYKVFERLDVSSLTDHPFFWYNTAILFYFGVTFLLGIFENFIREAPELISRFLWCIQLIANIGLNILIAMGLWKTNRK
jgi:hypothetical protein